MVAQVSPLASEVDRVAAGLSEQALAAAEIFLREVTAATARQAQSSGGAVLRLSDGSALRPSIEVGQQENSVRPARGRKLSPSGVPTSRARQHSR